MKFSLKRKQTSVELEDEGGIVRAYTLREMDGKGREEYLNLIASKAQMGTDGKLTGMKDFTGVHSSLISKCLFDEDGKVVPKNMIDLFPSNVIQGLFDEAQKLNGLNAEALKEAKNA